MTHSMTTYPPTPVLDIPGVAGLIIASVLFIIVTILMLCIFKKKESNGKP